jgi:hypothetical protein
VRAPRGDFELAVRRGAGAARARRAAACLGRGGSVCAPAAVPRPCTHASLTLQSGLLPGPLLAAAIPQNRDLALKEGKKDEAIENLLGVRQRQCRRQRRAARSGGQRAATAGAGAW